MTEEDTTCGGLTLTRWDSLGSNRLETHRNSSVPDPTWPYPGRSVLTVAFLSLDGLRSRP